MVLDEGKQADYGPNPALVEKGFFNYFTLSLITRLVLHIP